MERDRDGDEDRRGFEDKYKDWSWGRLQRALGKLKNSGQVVMGTPLCDEIRFLAHRLRKEIATRPSKLKPISDKSFGLEFWPACRRLFEGVTGLVPTFSLKDCFGYFSGVLSLDSLSSLNLFPIPDWFITIPPPSVQFDMSPPTYGEIAAIINRARSGSSASPLDQISAITLKKCPILRTILHNIIVNCWSSQYTPNPWRVG